MTAFHRCLFAALIAASAAAGPAALANGRTEGVIERQAADGVTIYTVDEKPVAETEAAPTINVYTAVQVVILRRNRRLEYYRRALGQRYTGFIKVYAGPQYPF